jgi:hypothetical protein
MKKLALLALPAVLSACAMQPPMSPRVDNMALPEAVRVPAGHQQTMSTLGKGEITYECRAKAGSAGAHEWVFVVPVATLADAKGSLVGKYYGGPTWEAKDGSRVTGKQVAVAPAMAGSIPLQLVKAEPAIGPGAMQGVSYIQRLNTLGGVAPAAPCTAATAGQKRQVAYQADYVFYRMD